MRLLNTKTFEFEVFYDEAIPPYAILSHRWYDASVEVSYQDFLARRKRHGAGFSKILRACELAASDRPESDGDNGSWIWIDTCCIDKESSAELFEAINSMWQWYQKATVCYAYLDDVPDKPTMVQEGQSTTASSGTSKALLIFRSRFRGSKWFTRGWTLQELLAPKHVEFLSVNWKKLGNKVELCEDIIESTGIGREFIIGSKPDSNIWSRNESMLKSCSVATKLSWAARRKTTRVEDMAYCLLGLLDINMPLLYGEGSKAFVRLQEELVRSGNDESIFAWSAFSKESDFLKISPLGHYFSTEEALDGLGIYPYLFADTPFRFASCGNVEEYSFDHRGPFQMTNKGLQMDAFLYEISGQKNEFLAPLNCGFPNRETSYFNRKGHLALQLLLINDDENIYISKGCVDLGQPEFNGIRSTMEVKLRRGLFDHPAFGRHRFAATRTLDFSLILALLPLVAYTLLRLHRGWWMADGAFSLLYYLNMAERKTIFISRNPRPSGVQPGMKNISRGERQFW